MPSTENTISDIHTECSVVMGVGTAVAISGNSDTLFIDCRYDLKVADKGHQDYLQAHIPGAVYACLHGDLSVARQHSGRHPLPPPSAMNKLFCRLGINPDSTVVLYDDAGGAMAAARAWWILRFMGHRRVCVLDGGWSAWRRLSAPVESGDIQPPAGAFVGCPKASLQVTPESMAEAPLVVDSREGARYRGEQENIDPIAGHIPGASNRPFRNNLKADDSGFLPATELRHDFLRLFAGNNPADVVFYCGSGVTACHNILAVCHAGLPMPKLYPGSWSQWCQLRLPVAIGIGNDV